MRISKNIRLLNYFLAISVCLCVFASCEYESDSLPATSIESKIIIEALITNERKQHDITIMRSPESLTSKPQPVSNARVRISNDFDTITFFADENKAGTYTSEVAFQATVGNFFLLMVNINDTIYTARNYAVPVTPLQQYAMVQSDDSAGFYSFTQAEENVASVTRVEINWQNVEGYENVSSKKKEAILYLYQLTTIDVNEIFSPKKETVYFPKGAVIVRKKYSVNPEFEKYLRSMLMETEWRGGLFDVEHANVISNFSNGALGYFAVSSVVSDTIVFR